ncbi:MAG: amidohydrolase [Candidatus Polarisedimenticolia bacterium]
MIRALSMTLALTGWLAATEPQAAPPDMADLILLNGIVHTMDPARPHASAVAVREGRILLAGNDAEALLHRGASTRVVDLAGRTVVPGLTDAHGHVLGLGLAAMRLDLKGTRSAEDIAAMVKQRAATTDPFRWIRGRGWDQNDWALKEFPGRALLDAAAPDHAVVLDRVDGHAIWVNSRALRLAGVTKDTPDPPGGRIVRDAAGEPTGVLVDAAENLVTAKEPPATRAETREALELGMRRCLAAGLTEVHDAGVSPDVLELYDELLVKGDFPFRVYAMLDPKAAQQATGPVVAPPGGRLTARAIKLYADGALGSRGAALLAPYADDSGNVGLPQGSEQELRSLVAEAAGKGLQVNVHAIGDRGNRMVLDAFAEALPAGGGGKRFRVEHAQVLHPDDIPRFTKLGVIASMQPTHATSDMPWAEARLGPERVKGAYAWRSLLDAGARLACGSDFPVESENPMLGLYAAVTRQDLEGQPQGGWLPSQRLGREEALRCFTLDAAYAAFEEDTRGTISAGKLADLTVLSKDPMTVDAAAIPSIVAEMTIVGGRVAYERK